MAKGTRTLGALGLGLLVGSLGLVGVTPPPAWGQVACGDVIGPGGIVILTNNVGPCIEDPALTVVGPVAFFLNGFTVSCAQDSIDTPVGIHVIGVRALVAHGTVRDCGDGMLIEGGGSHHITHITSRDNSDDGFEINSHRNTLTFNQANDNGDEGFIITGNYNTLSWNAARRNGQTSDSGDGFDIDPQNDGGNNNSLFHNTAEDNADEGFEVGGDNNVLKFNTARRNHQGFIVDEGARHNLLAFNVAWANDEDGFDINGDANTLLSNLAKLNGEDGIDVEEEATDNVLRGNIAFLNNQNNNGSFDLEDDNEDCDNNSWVNNFGTRNQLCIH